MNKTLSKVFDHVMESSPWTSMVCLSILAFVMLFAMVTNAHAATGSAGNAVPDVEKSIDRYVIAISANNGGKGRPMLRYAESDAKAFAAVLKEMGGVPRNNIFLVQEPSVSYLENHFDNLDKIINLKKGQSGRDEVLVYYSGHADEKGLRLGNEVYPWTALRKRVDELGADVKIAVIDACGSGAITRAKGGVAVPAFMVDQSSDMRGYAFITSSTQDESSQESDKLRGSFFTHSLVSGLRGAGDASGDGKVTLSEAYQFAFNETLQKTEATMGGAQHPSRDMNLAGTGDVVMTDLRSTSAGLDLDENVDGRLFIRDAHGELLAELNKKSGHAMSLGLPAGKYTIRLERPAEFKEASIVLAEGKREKLGGYQFKVASAEKTVSRGSAPADSNALFEEGSSMDSLDRYGRTKVTFNAVDHEKNPRKGVQIGFFVTDARENMIGTQVSLIANIARKEFAGTQISTGINVAKDISGIQVSAGANVARGMSGGQISTGVNVAKDATFQLAEMNFAAKSNVQLGVGNISDYTDVAVGVINANAHLNTAQIGVFNIGGKVKGRQIGVFNVCGHCEKTPIGLFNFVGNGVWSTTMGVDEMGNTSIDLKLGTAAFYTSFEFGRLLDRKKKFEYEDRFLSGLGLGTQFGRYGTHLSLDYTFLNTFEIEDKHFKRNSLDYVKGETSFHHRLRLHGTYEFVKGFGMTSGFSMNVVTEGYTSEIQLEPRGEWHGNFEVKDRKVRAWPGVFAGFTFGRF
ncbi:MAG: caspase family protein [Fibrobacter sp.]|nr:caspase family protein [Fibrobacter sp.]